MKHEKRTSRSYCRGRPTIGVLAGWEYAWTSTPLSYLDPIYRGICLSARKLNCNVLLGCGMGSWTDSSASFRPAWPLTSSDCDLVPISPSNADGLIAINPLHSSDRSRYLQDLIEDGYPVIFVAAGETGPAIVADNRSGILEAMQHLVEHGHQRVAFIAGSMDDLQGDSGSRLGAYRDAVELYRLAADPRLVAWGRHLYDGGYAAMSEILASGAPFTAVLASNDESALGAIKALREAGLRIPQDVGIVGFDDRTESSVQKPALSSVRVPLFKMGYHAAESLIRYLTGQAERIEPVQVTTRLVPRESCGCGKSDGPGAATAGRGIPVAGGRPAAEAMAAAVRAEAQHLPADEVEASCRRLVDAFETSLEQGDRSGFLEAVGQVIRQSASAGEDVYIWQAPLDCLGNSPGPAPGPAQELLAQARSMIGLAGQRQAREEAVGHRWMLNRLGTLTARLQAARDETQIYEVMAQHLPPMGIRTAWIVLFEADGSNPLARSILRTITAPDRPPIGFDSHDFPPPDLLPTEQPFDLALFPLTGPRGQLGFVAFDTAQLDLYGAIAQQLATALNSAHLYREATEGRRLAEEANQMKSRFLSTVSHELRTPLNVIVGLSGILSRESEEGRAQLPEAIRQDIERLNANAQHLGQLIGDVLDLASSDAGQLRLTKELVDLGQVMHMMAEAGRQLAEDKGLAWKATLPPSGPWVLGDRTRLRQVVLNLISNAIKFTMRGGVSLTLEPGRESVTVRVRDTGLGIPPEEQETIFDEFRRSGRSIARRYGGLGLGLAISRRLVELHGGTIGVHSSGQEGAGSTFYFTLPTVPLPAYPPARHPAAATPGGQGVLVLTSRSGTGERLREHLSQRGLEVQIALIEEASDWQRQMVALPPSAVVLDMSVAPDQGWSALKAIKANPATQGIPVLLCALAQDSGSVLELDYLTKPIELAELVRALDQHRLAAGPSRPTHTILVVDDDPATLEMHARIVQMHSPSNRVIKARNGREALEVLHRSTVDLILLDLMMPEIDGFSVLEAMREGEATRDIPVIVVTGQALTESDMARLHRGVAKVLSKGLFGPDETLAHLSAVLAVKRELSGEAQRLVRQAMAYVHEHFADAISRQDMARHVALSEDYLTFCFRKEVGLTPIAYLNRYRVQQARRLLTDTSKTITEIALEVGFSESGYFSRVFRREVGLPPEAYRQA